MLKFIRGQSGSSSLHQTKNVQERLRKEKLFTYSQINTYGFHNKPSTLAYSETLDLLAAGCTDGSVYLYGQPGVQLNGRHVSDPAEDKQLPGVQFIIFITSRLELLTLTQPNSLHLLNITQSKLEYKKTLHLGTKLKKITAVAVIDDIAFVGTEGGNVYRLNLNSFELLESETIRVDVMLQSAPETCKVVNPGTVEVLLVEGKKLFVGYQKGLVIEWEQNVPPKFHLTSNQLEDLTLHNGVLVSAHGDGSYMINGKATTPYGPYPCKRISKIRMQGDLVIFAGGMPRTYGDHNTVSVMKESANKYSNKSEHTAFDLPSRVVEFCVVKNSLLILTDEELIAIDLEENGWPLYRNPYLNCIHPSAITCFSFSNGKLDLVDADTYSSNNWPIQGGHCDRSKGVSSLLIFTGHEDGSVRCWNGNGGCMELLRVFSTFSLFEAKDADQRFDKDGEEEEWPPFRKVGSYDPYTDDPRLAVKKVLFCPENNLIFIGGTAGQVVILDASKSAEQHCKVTKVNLVTQESSFAWKGHEALETSQDIKAKALIQIHPPATITALVVEPSCDLIAVGTGHGFLLYNYKKNCVILTKSTLNPNDFLASGDTPISRRKSIKKSLRESFRRLRKGRGGSPTPGQNTMMLSKSNERAIEARSIDESYSSMVRCLTLTKTFIFNGHTPSWSLWVGLNRGTVQVYVLSHTCDAATLAKEIHLRHGAPILDILIIDNTNKQVNSKSDFTQQQHKVLICSEEQLKLFTLPSLRPYGKLKLTALEGCKLRRIGLAKFSEDPKDNYSICLTNTGDVSIISLPDLRRFFTINCMRREDISGIASFIPTATAEALFLKSSSEMQRVSFSANCTRQPSGALAGENIEKTPVLALSIQDESTDDITLDSIRDMTQNISIISESQTRTNNRNGNGSNNSNNGGIGVEIIAAEETAPATAATTNTISALLEVERERTPTSITAVLDSEV